MPRRAAVLICRMDWLFVVLMVLPFRLWFTSVRGAASPCPRRSAGRLDGGTRHDKSARVVRPAHSRRRFGVTCALFPGCPACRRKGGSATDVRKRMGEHSKRFPILPANRRCVQRHAFIKRAIATAIASSEAASYPCPQQNRRTSRQGVLRRGVGSLQPPARAQVGKARQPTSSQEICREIPSMIFKVMQIPSNIFKPRHTHDDHRKPPHFVCPSGRAPSASSRSPASALRVSFLS